MITMHATRKSTDNKTKSKIQSSKEEVSSSQKDEKKKVPITPRNYLRKASTTDIYGQKEVLTKAPKKSQATTRTTYSSPMKNLLKSSSSAVSQISRTSKTSSKVEAKDVLNSARKLKDEFKQSSKSARDIAISNVTINSPNAKKKLQSKGKIDNGSNKKVTDRDSTKDSKDKKKLDVSEHAGNTGRQRTKTRTLEDNEIKVLTPAVVDNNAEMIKLSRSLAAKPKAFYVDLDEGQSKVQNNEVNDEDISYEDDFESYESDFDSYNSSNTEQSANDDNSDGGGSGDSFEHHSQESKDSEEKMLDSGNFELQEAQRSACRTMPALDSIKEDKETDVKVSLTDEGFQDLSSSSPASSMKTVQIDIIRPLFIDFNKAKECKRKRKIFENLKQRAKDILSMITLHEMSYSLFEMKPIPYDLFMATFGRSNYTQIAVQTFEDSISEEVQTDNIECDDRWTQHPVEFSNHDIYLKDVIKINNSTQNNEDYLSKFTLLVNKESDNIIKNEIDTGSNYKKNPLRIYFEQKDGVGDCKVLRCEIYESKLRNYDFNVTKLNTFLKKVLSRVSHVLSLNTSDQEVTDVKRNSKFPFSKEYVSLSNTDITDEKFSFIKNAKITNVVFSDTKSNLIMTIHKKTQNSIDRSISCLWDLSIVRREPIKVIIAVSNITIARFRGNTDGIYAAALEDGSIHVWDLSEEATWRLDNTGKKATSIVEADIKTPTSKTERDREWNHQNSNINYNAASSPSPCQVCSYTSSAAAMNEEASGGTVVGFELVWHANPETSQGRKVVGQVCSLQNIGILTIWAIIRDKTNTSDDIGKAFWSKIKLELNQRISLIDYLSTPKEPLYDLHSNFNLDAAKTRMSLRRKENKITKNISRIKSASFDRSNSVASVKSKGVLPRENNWENGIICNDLKIMNYNIGYCYLVAKNCGEVLTCSRAVGSFKVNEIRVSNDTSSVTSLEVSTHGPYFLAATDSGTVNLCSAVQNRVLLTLDCRNRPQNQEKLHIHKTGRFIGSVTGRAANPEEISISHQLSIDTVFWPLVNPCCIYAKLKDGCLVVWDLAHSDIYAKYVVDNAAVAGATTKSLLALVTPEGEVQIHRVGNEQRAKQHQDLFSKYAALL